jgi:hypothetical protein
MAECLSDFSSPAGKRKNAPSPSSDGDSSPLLQKCKKANQDLCESFDEVSERVTNMSLETLGETLKAIQQSLKTLATKEDIQELRDGVRGEIDKVKNDLEKVSESMTERCEQLESRLFDVEVKLDKVIEENKSLKKENRELKETNKKTQSDINDLEQYGRRWNLRLFNVTEKQGETADDAALKVCSLFTDLVGVPTTQDDLEACHRVGRVGEPGSKKPRAIVVRFKNRALRDKVLANRKKLKGQKVSIGEDLTVENARLCNLAYKHSASLQSWSVNGKVFAKLKNGKTLRLYYGTDVDRMFVKAMSGKENDMQVEHE